MRHASFCAWQNDKISSRCSGCNSRNSNPWNKPFRRLTTARNFRCSEADDRAISSETISPTAICVEMIAPSPATAISLQRPSKLVYPSCAKTVAVNGTSALCRAKRLRDSAVGLVGEVAPSAIFSLSIFKYTPPMCLLECSQHHQLNRCKKML